MSCARSLFDHKLSVSISKKNWEQVKNCDTGLRIELNGFNHSKSTPGDATNCSADVPCDGTTSVPNSDYSACC